MKRFLYYKLAIFRRWANTPAGEKKLTTVFTVMSIILVVDVLLLAGGVLL